MLRLSYFVAALLVLLSVVAGVAQAQLVDVEGSRDCASSPSATRIACTPGQSVVLNTTLTTASPLASDLSVTAAWLHYLVDASADFSTGSPAVLAAFESGAVTDATGTLAIECPPVPSEEVGGELTLRLTTAGSDLTVCADFASGVGPFFDGADDGSGAATCTDVFLWGNAEDYSLAAPPAINDLTASDWTALPVSWFSSPVRQVVLNADAQPMVMLADGSVWAWGFCSEGVCGSNQTLPLSEPLPLPERVIAAATGAPIDASQQTLVASSTSAAVALLHAETGAIVAWGSTGDGSFDALTLNGTAGLGAVGVATASPLFDGSSPAKSARSLALGEAVALVLAGDGVVYAVGTNHPTYNLFANASLAGSDEPVPVAGLPDDAAVESVWSNGISAFAVLTTGEVWGWGSNSQGNLGYGNTSTYEPPARLPVSDAGRVLSVHPLSSGGGTLWLMADGRVLAAGISDFVGAGLSPAPGSVRTATSLPLFEVQPAAAVAPGSLGNVVLTRSGAAYAAGRMADGAIGNGYAVAALSLTGSVNAAFATHVAVASLPTTSHRFVAVAAGPGAAAAIGVRRPPAFTLAANAQAEPGDELSLSAAQPLPAGLTIAAVTLVAPDGTSAACENAAVAGSVLRCRIAADAAPLAFYRVQVASACGPVAGPTVAAAGFLSLDSHDHGVENAAAPLAALTALAAAAAAAAIAVIA